MTESDPETIALRVAESELRQLHQLRDDTAAELQAAIALAAPAAVDPGRAMVERALVGDHGAAADALQHAREAVSKASYLQSLLRAIDDQIETKGFRVFDLHQAAIAADSPRIGKIRAQRLKEQLAALGTQEPVVLPDRRDDWTSWS